MKSSKQTIKKEEILILLKYYFEETNEITEEDVLSIVTHNSVAFKFADNLVSILSKSNLSKNELFKILFKEFIVA